MVVLLFKTRKYQIIFKYSVKLCCNLSLLHVSKKKSKNSNDLNIFIHDHRRKKVTNYKYLGVYVDSNLAWKEHLSYMQKRSYRKIRLINRLSSFLTRSVLLEIYKQTMLPIFDYGCSVWMRCSNSTIDSPERLQNQVMRTILKANRTSCTQRVWDLNWDFQH